MILPTEVWRYDKNQIILVDGQEMSLIQHLKQLRESKNITKKRISNLVKHNDSWYSQVERNGKNGDDNRQRTIYRVDLINTISMLVFGATTAADLETYFNSSINYIDKVIKAVPLKSSARQIDWLSLHQLRTVDEQSKLLDSLLSTQEKLLRQTFENLNGNENKDYFLDALRNMNTSLRIDPLFIMFLVGLPFADFLYESEQAEINALLRTLMEKIDTITNDNNNGNVRTINECMALLRETVTDYTKQTFTESILNKTKTNDILMRLNEMLKSCQ